MILTRESRRTWWCVMLAAWGLAAVLAVCHVQASLQYRDLMDRAAERVPPLSTPMRHIVPTNYADAQTWVRYALTSEPGAPARVRYTHDDNAPEGREVHWNSAFAQLIADAGELRAAFTGEPRALATERMLPWFNLPLLLVVVVGFSAWTGRRAGAGGGALIALGLIGTEWFYAGFAPLYVDHHGVLAAASLGVVLGALFMGGGWWRTPTTAADGLLPVSRAAARGAAVFSALCGAGGLWFSAASTIPTIALTGAAGLITVWTAGRAMRREGAEFDPALWRLWGRVGAVASVVFYLWEYAPAHLGLRLEVNHPLFALAWLGGSELIAWLAERFLTTTGSPRPPLWRLLGALIAVGVAPLTILVGGARVFVVSDPFVSEVPKMVSEGMSLIAIKRALGWPAFFQFINWNVVPLFLLPVLFFRRGVRDKGLLVFVAIVALGFVVLVLAQVRWSHGASGPLLCLLLVVVAAVLQGRGAWLRWGAVVAIGAVGFAPATISRIRNERARVALRLVDPADLQQLLYRDAAAAIRASQPAGDIVLLSSPNASVGMGYYGGFKTLGTLYWENYAGLRAAAEIFCTPSPERARELIQQHGITHLAMISEENFLAQYFSLLRPKASSGEFEQTFGSQLLHEQKLPRWLRPISYRAPADVAIPGLRVLLLQVVPEQSEVDALWNLALAQLAAGDLARAGQNFEAAIRRAPEDQRAAFCQTAGNLCYASGAPTLTVRFYRTALTAGENPVLAGNLAWVLATSTDAGARNGAEALALAQRLPAGDAAALSALAAAFAETGRFPEAEAAALRAYELVKATDPQGAESVYAPRVKAYRARKPWRQ